MFVTLRRFAGIVAVSFLAFSAAIAADFPTRATGLWILKSPDNPFADWSLCVDDSKGHFVDSDVWSDFTTECTVVTSRWDGDQGALEADCALRGTGDVKLTLTYSGDFEKSYRFQSVTSFKVAGDQTSQTNTAEVTFAGQCPAELRPGMKKMTRTGIILGK